MQVRDQTSPICNIVIFSHQNCCQFKDLPIIMHLKIQVSPDLFWFTTNVMNVVSNFQVFYINLHRPFNINVQWKGLMTCLTTIHILRDYWTNSDGVFADMQIISYSFIILKHFFDSFESYWFAESPIVIFVGTIGISHFFFYIRIVIILEFWPASIGYHL